MSKYTDQTDICVDLLREINAELMEDWSKERRKMMLSQMKPIQRWCYEVIERRPVLTARGLMFREGKK